jgi:hypothetical protein
VQQATPQARPSAVVVTFQQQNIRRDGPVAIHDRDGGVLSRKAIE